MKNNTVKFIDLFAGLGGIRLGFEKAFNDVGMETECVMTSEIKPYAVKTLKHNFGHEFFRSILILSRRPQTRSFRRVRVKRFLQKGFTFFRLSHVIWVVCAGLAAQV